MWCIGSPSRVPSRRSFMSFARDPARKTSVSTSRAKLDELARLHDGRQVTAILSEHIDVPERIPVDDQDIGIAPRLNLAEFRFHQDLGIHGSRRLQDGGGRLQLPPDRELTGLVDMQMSQQIR